MLFLKHAPRRKFLRFISGVRRRQVYAGYSSNFPSNTA